MLGDTHRDQEIAGRVARRSLALPLQPNLLTGHHTGWNLDVELLAGRQSDTFLRTLDRLFQRHRHGNREIEVHRHRAGVEIEARSTPARTRPTRLSRAKHAVENVLKAAAANATGARVTTTEGVSLEATGARARTAAARKTLEARFALGINLAAVELLALVGIANDLVGRIQFGETSGGLRIVRVGVGGILLGKLAKGALDRRSAGTPRHPQDLIGVAHPSVLLQGKHQH